MIPTPSPHTHWFYHHGKCTGFTLIDTLVALTILALGFSSLIHLHTKILELNGRTKARAEALRLAEGKLEQLRYAALLSHSDDWTAVGDESLTGFTTEYQLHWAAFETDLPGLRSLAVTISWKSTNGDQRITIMSRVAGIEPLATSLWFMSEI